MNLHTSSKPQEKACLLTMRSPLYQGLFDVGYSRDKEI